MAGIWTSKWNKIKLEVWEETLIIDYDVLLLHVENKKVPSYESYSCSYKLFSLSWWWQNAALKKDEKPELSRIPYIVVDVSF